MYAVQCTIDVHASATDKMKFHFIRASSTAIGPQQSWLFIKQQRPEYARSILNTRLVCIYEVKWY